jgi:hypothetical protein
MSKAERRKVVIKRLERQLIKLEKRIQKLSLRQYLGLQLLKRLTDEDKADPTAGMTEEQMQAEIEKLDKELFEEGSNAVRDTDETPGA